MCIWTLQNLRHAARESFGDCSQKKFQKQVEVQKPKVITVQGKPIRKKNLIEENEKDVLLSSFHHVPLYKPLLKKILEFLFYNVCI